MHHKVARICWNSNDWISPSGATGKSTVENSFECDRGFGHEEWLRDFSTIIKGYKYSFLQPVNTPTKSHQGKEYSIRLYTLRDKRKLCLGYIKHAICLTRDEASIVTSQYLEKGWFSKMEEQLKSHSVNTSGLIDKEPLHNFNIKFKPDDLVWFDEPHDITEQYGNHRYVLMNCTDSNVSGLSKKKVMSDGLVSDLLDIYEGDLSSSEKELQVTARVGQGKFRKNVIKQWGGERCVVTLIDVKEMLIASHIKAWKDCLNTNERVDGANGIMLCAHVDKLFDNHLATFKPKNGRYYLEVSKSIDARLLTGLGIEHGAELNTINLDMASLERFKVYMEQHNNIFHDKQSVGIKDQI